MHLQNYVYSNLISNLIIENIIIDKTPIWAPIGQIQLELHHTLNLIMIVSATSNLLTTFHNSFKLQITHIMHALNCKL